MGSIICLGGYFSFSIHTASNANKNSPPTPHTPPFLADLALTYSAVSVNIVRTASPCFSQQTRHSIDTATVTATQQQSLFVSFSGEGKAGFPPRVKGQSEGLCGDMDHAAVPQLSYVTLFNIT